MLKRSNEIREKFGEFERIIKFNPAYDERYDPKLKGCGCHGVNMYLVLIGPLGAISWWIIPVTARHRVNKEFFS